MTENKFTGLFSGRILPHELGFHIFYGTDCGWASCYRKSTHFHCVICGYSTSQVNNVISHRKLCEFNSDFQQKELTQLVSNSDPTLLQHEILQSNQIYSNYLTSTPTTSLSSQQNNQESTNPKVITTQQSAMFNFVLPTQNSQYTALYGTQTVFPNPNLFSPSSCSSFGQVDQTWLPQTKLISSNIHSSSHTPDLLNNSKNQCDKFESSNSPPCCGRISNIETSMGMCSPLTAETYKIVSKEHQNKLDTQNCYCNSQNLMGFNSQTSPCKFFDSVPHCSISLLLLDQNNLKEGEELIDVEDLCFETSKNEQNHEPFLKDNESFVPFMEVPKKNIQITDNFSNEKKDLKLNLESFSDESDIIVEESDSELKTSTPLTPILKSVLNSKCLVCNKSPSLDSENNFVKISKELPLTKTTQVSILTKLSQVIDDEEFNKLKDCLICPRCLNLINVVDHLEIKLDSAKKELVEIYKSKDCKDEENFFDDEDSKNKLFCHVCNKQFSTSSYLEKHKQIHTKVFNYYCEYCGKGFAILQKLENHLILHSKSSRFQCELCGKRFIQKCNLTDHIKKHKGEFKHQCGVCQKKFIRKSVYKTHLLTHTSDRSICQHCGKQFKNLANLTIHIKICSGDLKFCCDKCDKKFPIKSLLRKHIALRHNSEYKFFCRICKKGFGKNSDLKTHLRSHSDIKSFKCSKCDNIYKSLSNLNQHLKVHSKNSALECNVCGKKFTRKDSLDDHLNQHTGIKPYKCTTCWKTFANKINYNIHLKRHNGTLKQTPCPICGKLFTKGLKDHLISHSGQKPYSCKQCQAVFTVKSSLNKHVKVKHNINKITK